MTTLQIDCTRCLVRDIACADCVVSVLMDETCSAATTPTSANLALDTDEQRALQALCDAGIVPPLRMVATQRYPQQGCGEAV